MRQNPVYTVWLRHSRYPLACSAAGREELPRFGDSAGEIMTERNGQRWEGREHHLPLSPCINLIVTSSGAYWLEMRGKSFPGNTCGQLQAISDCSHKQ